MSEIVNVDFVTKVVEVQVNDTETESLAALAAVNSAKRAEEISGRFIDDANVIFNGIKAQYGYPFVASTVSAMTDTTKIYVYTGSESGYTAGNWYYYNGSAWVSGGVFNSVEGSTKAEMSLFGIDDLLWDNTSPATKTQNGVTYTVDNVNKTVTVSSGGNPSTGASVLNYHSYSSGVPAWLQKGKKYYIHLDTNSDVKFQVTDNSSAATFLAVADKDNPTAEFVIPNDANGLLIRLNVLSGKTVNTVVRPFISEDLSLGELEKQIQTDALSKKGYLPTNTDLDTVVTTGFYGLVYGYTYTNLPSGINSISGVLTVYNVSTYVQYQILSCAFPYGYSYIRAYSSGSWGTWYVLSGTDKTLTVANQSADAKVVGDTIKKVDTEMSLFGIEDLLWNPPFRDDSPRTSEGVTYTVDTTNLAVTMANTSTGDSFFRFYGNDSALPSWATAGKYYYAHMNTSSGAKLQVFYYDSDGLVSTPIVNTNTCEKFQIPADAVGLMIRIFVANGGTTDTVVRPFITEKAYLPDYAVSKKYVAFGDSLTKGTVWTLTPGADAFQSAEKYRIPTRIALATGFVNNYVNEGVGGTGYVRQSDGQTITGKILAYDFSDVQLVTVMGGANDTTDAVPLGTSSATANDGTICGAIKAIIDYIKTNYSKTQLVVIQPLPMRNNVDNWNHLLAGGWTLNTFDAEVSQLCHDNHVGYVNWWESLYCDTWKDHSGGYNDSVGPNYSHPTTEEDYALLGDFIGGKVSALCKGMN